jgi:hypothetical protein
MILAERDRLRQQLAVAPPQLLLAIQDTTDLDMTGNRVSGKLGSLNYANRKGYYAHNHLLLNQQGISLGLFGQFLWNRNAAFFGQDRSLLPLKDKESARWVEQFEQLQDFFADFPQHKVIDICDREADFYELFQARRLPNVHLLVRSSKDRELTDEEMLWTKLASQTESRTYKAKIFDEKGKEHEVTFQVKHAAVTIQASYRAKRDQPDQSNPVQLHGILVEQVGPVQDWQKKPIVWRLLTTLPVESFEQALEVVEFYILRWRIEEFHYVLKQGSKIEATQIEEPGGVENAITLYSLLAWKVQNLRYSAALQAEQPIEDFGFTQRDFLVLATILNHWGRANIDLKKPCPGIKQFSKYLSMLATTAKSKKPPGVKALWVGLAQLRLLVSAFDAFT